MNRPALTKNTSRFSLSDPLADPPAPNGFLAHRQSIGVKVLMRDRKLLTLDEELVAAQARVRAENLAAVRRVERVAHNTYAGRSVHLQAD